MNGLERAKQKPLRLSKDVRTQFFNDPSRLAVDDGDEGRNGENGMHEKLILRPG